jgi:hypothetical protein
MQFIKAESEKLIKAHFQELQEMNEELGGVHIARLNGAVAVVGIENAEKKVIFQTGFVSDVEAKVLDAQIVVQDLLEEAGIEALSEYDLNLALDDMSMSEPN